MPNNDLPDWVLWTQALGLPACGIIIAATGVCIARQQKRLADIRLQHDLYERRFRLFETAKKLLIAAQDITLSLDEFFAFARGTSDAVFLLKPEIVEYLYILRERAARLRMIQGRLKDQNLDQAQRGIFADQAAELENWFNDQFDILVAKFKPSLRLDAHSLE